jgi:CRISPR system Cascade subunit CasA
MSHHSFNVLTDPWIPVIGLDGSRKELGILSCLEQAPKLREIRDPAPIVEFGLYRLLVAFVLDALILAGRRPEHISHLKNLIEKGCFEMNLFKDYANKCGDVFDLFHPERPFLQTRMDGKNSKSIAGLFPAVPSGTNVVLWYHEHEDDVWFSVEQAARLLTTIAPFMTAGGAGLSPSINGAPPLYVLPMGLNLFQTIVINIPLRTKQDRGDEPVAWRQTRVPGDERTHTTTVEALTWRPRCIQLVPDDDNRVREMYFTKGDSTRLSWIDANVAYKYEKDKVTPIRLRENRPPWRDIGPLTLLREDVSGRGTGDNKVAYQRPDVVQQAFEISREDSDLTIQVYGMRTDQNMKIFEWTKSTWSVPAKLGQSTRLGSLVHHELQRAESAARALRSSILELAPNFERDSKSPVRNLADRCERAYWQRLESNFYPLMHGFASLDANAPDNPDLIAVTANSWRNAIKTLAIEQFEAAAADIDADSDALERQVRARTRLERKLEEVIV